MQKALFLILIAFLVGILGCHRPMNNPESVDPIYKDYQKQADEAKKALEQSKKYLEKSKKDFEAAPLRSNLRRNAQEEVFANQTEVDKAEQTLFYLEQKVASRKKYARDTYKKLFEEGKAWPDTQEYNEYLTHKKLVNAPREWKPAISPTPSKSASPAPGGQKKEGGH